MLAGLRLGAVPSAVLRPACDWDLAGGLPAGISFLRGSAATCVDAAVRIVPIPANGPRFDHDPATGKPLGLLIEGPRTNFLPDSFAPATRTVSLPAGSYTLSVGSGGSLAVTGAAAGTAAPGVPLTLTLSAPGSLTVTVQGQPHWYQCEDGPFASSPIATPPGASARREADEVRVLLGSWHRQEAGTWIVDFRPGAGFVPAQYLMTVSDGTASERHSVYRWAAGLIAYDMNAGGVQRSSLVPANALVALTPSRVAAAWSRQGVAFCLNGGPVVTAAVPALAAGISRMTLGAQTSGLAQSLFGHIRRVRYFPDRLPASLLRSMTATP
ncbi:hypothetical protein [Rhodospirillum centenum]|uniref:Uncharacterized protein n=1 Tax=Rhodospirillum centenum (strain ATCC 51521 / SW) TaxID=414684 RepID=B6IYH5_RHOCS|nr:hypothetical protein [Rhodospirillum centenum]ACJ01349.1 hypothetical protein RC1_4008 [Rhodospirillum centenum SW]